MSKVPDNLTTPPTPLGGDAAAAAAAAAQQPSSRQELDPAEWVPGPSDLGPDVTAGLNQYNDKSMNGVFLVTPSGWLDAVRWVEKRLQAKQPLPSGVGAVVVDAAAAQGVGPDDTPGGKLRTSRRATLVYPTRGRRTAWVHVLAVSQDCPQRLSGGSWGGEPPLPRPLDAAKGGRAVTMAEHATQRKDAAHFPETRPGRQPEWAKGKGGKQGSGKGAPLGQPDRRSPTPERLRGPSGRGSSSKSGRRTPPHGPLGRSGGGGRAQSRGPEGRGSAKSGNGLRARSRGPLGPGRGASGGSASRTRQAHEWGARPDYHEWATPSLPPPWVSPEMRGRWEWSVNHGWFYRGHQLDPGPPVAEAPPSGAPRPRESPERARADGEWDYARSWWRPCGSRWDRFSHDAWRPTPELSAAPSEPRTTVRAAGVFPAPSGLEDVLARLAKLEKETARLLARVASPSAESPEDASMASWRKGHEVPMEGSDEAASPSEAPSRRPRKKRTGARVHFSDDPGPCPRASGAEDTGDRGTGQSPRQEADQRGWPVAAPPASFDSGLSAHCSTGYRPPRPSAGVGLFGTVLAACASGVTATTQANVTTPAWWVWVLLLLAVTLPTAMRARRLRQRIVLAWLLAAAALNTAAARTAQPTTTFPPYASPLGWLQGCTEVPSCRPVRLATALVGPRVPFDATLGYPGEGQGWRILTVNVTALGNRHDELRERIFAECEVALLQETKHDKATTKTVDRAWALSGHRVVWGASAEAGQGKSAGVAIAARTGWAHPAVLDGHPVTGSRRWQAAVLPKSATGLPAPLLVVSLYGMVRGNTEAVARQATAEVVQEFMHILGGWHGPWLVAGDVNIDPSNAPGLAAMVSQGMAVELGALGNGSGPTFFQNGNSSRLSSVWASRQLAPWWESTELVAVGAADHMAVAVEFRTTPPPQLEGWQLAPARPTPPREAPDPSGPEARENLDAWRRDLIQLAWDEWAETHWPPDSDDPAALWARWTEGVQVALGGRGPTPGTQGPVWGPCNWGLKPRVGPRRLKKLWRVANCLREASFHRLAGREPEARRPWQHALDEWPRLPEEAGAPPRWADSIASGLEAATRVEAMAAAESAVPLKERVVAWSNSLGEDFALAGGALAFR